MNKPSIRAGETHTRPATAVKTAVVAEPISSDPSSLLFNKRPLARIQKPAAHGEITFKDSESARNQNSSPANSSKRTTSYSSHLNQSENWIIRSKSCTLQRVENYKTRK
ncbi:hypothetical protein [Marinobacterium stanieri]|uniref:hypothetical protein n=1 Tax=Marinobacterium stanieri TaxID=49186 RepID=UPI001112354B|nr:hypothetical protein [Marinobacterium stanieri]